MRSQKTSCTRTCSINPAVPRSAESCISERRTLWERRLDRLGDYLADTADSPDTGPAPRLTPDHMHDQAEENR